MELPVKFEIPRLSHSDLLRVCLPLVPGLVFFVDEAWAGVRPIDLAAKFGLGYKTGLTVCIIFCYLIGLMSSQVVDTISSWFARRLWPAKLQNNYADPYWRHLMAEYIGAAQCPEAMSPDTETVAHLLDRIVERNSEARESRLKMQAKRREMQETFEAKQSELFGMPEGPEKQTLDYALKSIQAQMDKLDIERSKKMTKQAREYAWLQLSSAMSLAESRDNPFGGYDSLMLALLTSSVIQFYFSITVQHERSILIVLFLVAVAAMTIYQRSQVYKLNKSHTELNSVGIAWLVNEIKARKDKG